MRNCLWSALSLPAAALLAAGAASALTIDNGLAPPNPANVVDFATLDLVVADCGACPPPAPTQVDVVAGGSVVDLDVFDTSLVRLDGGSIVATEVWDTATFVVLGGVVGGDVDANGASLVQILGGQVDGALHALESATIEIYGSGFAIDGMPVALGPLSAASGALTGTLASGEALDADFLRVGSIVLVPEPSVAGMFALGCAALGAARSLRCLG